MEIIEDYKCPCCGAPLVYSGSRKKLHCDSCGNDFDIDTMRELSDDESRTAGESSYNWEEYKPREYGSTENGELASYTCPSCGAEITGDANLGSTVCPYCGNAAIVKKSFDGVYMPDYIIPFRIDKNEAMKKFMANVQGKIFLPKEFKDESKLKEITGMYVPFWMFDCKAEGDAVFRGQRISAWSDSNYNYTKTDYYKLFRSGKVSFRNVPVDASLKADDAYMEGLEPFDCNDAMDFQTAYLSGYLADKYDVPVEESIKRANERIKASFTDIMTSTVLGYSGVVPEGTRVDFNEGKVRYALLPVWWLNIKYNGEMYKFALNGQTGKAVGEFPSSKKKIAAFFGGLSVVFVIIAIILWYLLG